MLRDFRSPGPDKTQVISLFFVVVTFILGVAAFLSA